MGLESDADQAPEMLVRKGRAIAAGAAMSYAQSARLALVVGGAYERTRRHAEAIEVIRPRVREAEGGTQRYWRARVSAFLANLYLLNYAEIDVSVRLFDSAISDFEGARERAWVGASLTMLGVAHRANDDALQAADCFRRALSSLGRDASAAQRTAVATSLAFCLIDLERFEEAGDTLNPVLAVIANNEFDDASVEVGAYAAAAAAKAGTKSRRQTELYLDAAKQRLPAVTDRYTLVLLELAQAKVHECAGKIPRAAEHLLKASQICVESGLHLPHMDTLRAQVRLGKKAGNFGSALGAMEALDRLHRRLEDERSRLKLGDFDAQRNLDSANEYARRLQREVDAQTKALADTVKRLQSEAEHRQASEQRSEYLAGHDLVTGLASRRRFFSAAQDRIKALPIGEALGLILIGIHPPVGLSEHLGVAGVDTLMAKLAKELQRNVVGASLGRYSDWRFACITDAQPNNAVASHCTELGEIICQALSLPMDVEDAHVSLNVAAGVSIIGSSSDDVATALTNADAALEYASTQFDIKTYVFDDALAMRQVRLRTLRASLAALDESGGLYVTFQPLVDASTMKVKGFESLARWKHPVLGYISPVEFIPMSETLSTINALGLEIAILALRDYSTTLLKQFPDAYVTINVSMLQLREPHFVSDLRKVCRDAQVDSTKIVLEITESQFASGDDTVEANLKRLRGHGFRFAIDDFGTGYSSLWRLSQIDVQTVKVARELVVGAVQSGQGRMLLNRAVQICRDLDRLVVAEGIEGEAERQVALEAGCDQLQGYMFSKPLPAGDLVTHLAWQFANAA